MATTYVKEPKPGAIGNSALTWDDMTESWDDVVGTWDDPRGLDATGYTKETKPTTTFTKDSGVSASYTKEPKP